MIILNSSSTDIDEIYRLYDIASAYQKTKNVVVWPNFERQLVETELAENRQWKLIIDGQVTCVWAITFNDPEIWEERDADAAIYIHRIATNPNFRGHNFVEIIVNWAKQYAKSIHKDYIRLDTLGNNTGLITHYSRAGFDFLGIVDLKSTTGLPQHYQDTKGCCLFQIEL
jgi:ribosomal protein S18 acetylase RimI-like enzyme